MKPNFLQLEIMLAILVFTVLSFFPDFVPYTLTEFWIWDSDVIYEAIIAGWPLYLFAVFFSAFSMVIHFGDMEKATFLNFLKSIPKSAGTCIAMSLCFYYVNFFASMISFKAMDWILGGCLFGKGFLWCYYKVASFIVNLLSFFQLDWLLNNTEYPWYVGAAVISVVGASLKLYKKKLSRLSGAIVGFFLFWIIFQYGLVAAIVVNFIASVSNSFTDYASFFLEDIVNGHPRKNQEET